MFNSYRANLRIRRRRLNLITGRLYIVQLVFIDELLGQFRLAWAQNCMLLISIPKGWICLAKIGFLIPRCAIIVSYWIDTFDDDFWHGSSLYILSIVWNVDKLRYVTSWFLIIHLHGFIFLGYGRLRGAALALASQLQMRVCIAVTHEHLHCPRIPTVDVLARIWLLGPLRQVTDARWSSRVWQLGRLLHVLLTTVRWFWLFAHQVVQIFLVFHRRSLNEQVGPGWIEGFQRLIVTCKGIFVRRWIVILTTACEEYGVSSLWQRILFLLIVCPFGVTSFSECIGSLLLQGLRPMLWKDGLSETFFASPRPPWLILLFNVVNHYDVVALNYFQIRVYISAAFLELLLVFEAT